MLNRKYYPFERNSYYFGKLLTAKDFESEQKYFNDKRRFTNRLMGANGIVAGMGVIRADDASVVIQAGCALDASGREIVMPETRVVKLSTIEGYQSLTTSVAYLGISYKEIPTDKVYAVMAQDASGQEAYNKMREEYQLVLMDEVAVENIRKPMDDFVERKVLYSDGDVEVVQYTPLYLPLSDNMIIKTQIRKIGMGTGDYSFCYDLTTPNFENEQSQKKFSAGGNNLRLSHGDVRTFTYILKPEEHIWGASGTVAITASELVVQKNGEIFPLKENFEMAIKPIGKTVEEFYLSEYYNSPMDKALDELYDQRLWIGKLNLIRQNNQIIIDTVVPTPFDQYSYNPQQLMMIRRLEAYYPSTISSMASSENFYHPQGENSPSSSSERRMTSGVFDLGISLGHDRKKAVFSHEIMHGLGKGPVYVDVSLEYINAGEPGKESTEIILGDKAIFAEEEGALTADRIYNVQTAVKALPDRGTFIVGAKLGDNTGLISLRVRWFAYRADEIDNEFKPTGDSKPYILVNPDTIVIKPKATAHISPIFVNMPTEPCNYSLVDGQGGSIDQNGVYTAPAKEGVYEVRIEAVSNPFIYTHAFVIVSQNKKEEDTN